MNRKIQIAAICLASILVSSCGTSTEIKSSKTQEKWRDAYIEFLTELEKDSNPDYQNAYDLAQINDDGIPELLVASKTAGHQQGVVIYTYANGKIQEVGTFGTWGNVEYVSGKGIIIDTEGSGMGDMIYTFYDMTGSTAQKKGQLCISGKEVDTYYIDGKLADRATYEKVFWEWVGFPQNEITVRGGGTGYCLENNAVLIGKFVNGYPWGVYGSLTLK